MKKYLLLAAIMMLPWLSEAALSSLLNSGPLSIKWVVTTQGPVGATALDKTNTTATSTNVTEVLKSTVTNSIFNNANLVALLENSFSTTFPTNTQLVLQRVGNSVGIFLTTSDTNIERPLGTNLTMNVFPTVNPVLSGVQTVISKSSRSGVSNSDTKDETFMVTEILNYDDTGLTTADGTHSQFQFQFVVVDKSSENVVSDNIKDKVTLQGFGFGMIRNQNVIFQGTGTATITGLLVVP